MKMFRYTAVNRFCCLASAAVIICVLSTYASAADKRYLWQSRDQFVALESQDAGSTGPAPANDHPAELKQERIIALLSAMEIRAEAGSKPAPLFTTAAVQALAPYLQQALQQASPFEDVTFAIIGLHDTLYGLAKSPKVTTGRFFYTAGRLNMIVGLVQQEVRDRDDRRLFPFTPGSRHKTAQGEWTLLPALDQHGYVQSRKDWVTFSNDWQAVVPPVAKPHAPAVPAAPVQPGQEKQADRKPSERLSILNELMEQGLISAEEYRAKRLEILNGL